jgi:hypothetical protein
MDVPESYLITEWDAFQVTQRRQTLRQLILQLIKTYSKVRRRDGGETILREVCFQGYPKAQVAFKDLMIH